MGRKLAKSHQQSEPALTGMRPLIAFAARAVQGKTNGNLAPARNRLPEYLEAPEVEALIRCAPDGTAALPMLIQWRAGLRVSEALALTVGDLSLEGDRPTLVVRHGKGNRARRVPVHPELRAALREALAEHKRAMGNGDE